MQLEYAKDPRWANAVNSVAGDFNWPTEPTVWSQS
jgi:hypothetical protein